MNRTGPGGWKMWEDEATLNISAWTVCVIRKWIWSQVATIGQCDKCCKNCAYQKGQVNNCRTAPTGGLCGSQTHSGDLPNVCWPLWWNSDNWCTWPHSPLNALNNADCTKSLHCRYTSVKESWLFSKSRLVYRPTIGGKLTRLWNCCKRRLKTSATITFLCTYHLIVQLR